MIGRRIWCIGNLVPETNRTAASIGNKISRWIEDEDGRKVNIGYDPLARPTKDWADDVTGQDDDTPLVENAYDMFDEVTSFKSRTDSTSSARESTFTYDVTDRSMGMSYPGGLIGSEEAACDSVGNPLWTKDGNGLYALYHYNDLHLLDAIAYSGTEPESPYDGEDPSPDVSVSYYTNTGFVHELDDSTGTSQFAYDERGRLTSYTPPSHAAITYTYNDLDEVKSITSGSYNVQYKYYASGQLKSVWTDSGTTKLAEYGYDEVGLPTGITYGNGVSAAFAYGAEDPRYPLSSITYSNSGGTLLGLGYTSRDYSLNPRAVSDTILGNTTYPEYDPMGQLTGATYPNPVPDQPAGGSYGYDWVGNRTNPPEGSNAMVYDAADRLTSWPGMCSYTYYPDGSLHEVKNPGGTITLAHYEYTDNGLLETATYGSESLENTWDAMGNRVGLSVNSANYSFLYNITAGVPSVIEEVKSGSPGKTYYYYRDPNGVLIARRDAAVSDSWQYYHYDELGSTRLITDKDGVVTDSYAYDAYGSVIAHNGSTTDNPYQYVGALGYYTHYQDHEFKLLQLGFRFYDPETGRFTQQDPIGSGINWYAYCGGNPLAGVDPWGLSWYDGWLNGDWGRRIPILGGLAERAGTDYGNWESGRGSGWRAAGSIALAGGATIGAGVGIFYGGVGIFRGGAWAVGRIAARRAAAATGTALVTHWYPEGEEAVIQAGHWVIRGGQNWWTYLMSGVIQRGYPYANAVSAWVSEEFLSNPPGLEQWKGAFPWLQQIYNGPTVPPCPPCP